MLNVLGVLSENSIISHANEPLANHGSVCGTITEVTGMTESDDVGVFDVSHEEVASGYSTSTSEAMTGVWSLESGYLTTLYSCDDCQRRVPISCGRRQASDPWLTLTTVGESGDGALPGPLPDVGLSVM